MPHRALGLTLYAYYEKIMEDLAEQNGGKYNLIWSDFLILNK